MQAKKVSYEFCKICYAQKCIKNDKRGTRKMLCNGCDAFLEEKKSKKGKSICLGINEYSSYKGYDVKYCDHTHIQVNERLKQLQRNSNKGKSSFNLSSLWI